MNDYSLEHLKYLKKIKREKYIILGLQFFIVFLLIGIWELASRFNIINTFLFSSPIKIVNTVLKLFLTGGLLEHIGITFMELLISIIISFGLGLIVAIILWCFPIINKVIDPFITIINSLPKVALGPLIIIWFGANTYAIVFMSLLISLFITIINIYMGFMQVPDYLLIMVKSFKATKWQSFRYVVLPYNLPNIVSTLKVNISMNLIGVIMGELLVSKKGLGYLIMYGSQVFNLDLVISCIIILGIISYLLYICINKIK